MKWLSLFLIPLGVFTGFCLSWPREGFNTKPVFQHTGDRGFPFTVSVGTTTPVRLYTSEARDREILFQSTSATYYIYCGTHSAVSATSGTRFWIPPKPSALFTNAYYNLWCISESAAAGAVELIGVVDRDSKDGD